MFHPAPQFRLLVIAFPLFCGQWVSAVRLLANPVFYAFWQFQTGIRSIAVSNLVVFIKDSLGSFYIADISRGSTIIWALLPK
jgi:hypothetical protein